MSYFCLIKNKEIMNAEIKNKLTANREMVELRFQKMVESYTRRGASNIGSKNFFFKVVAQSFEDLSVVKTNRILKGRDFDF